MAIEQSKVNPAYYKAIEDDVTKLHGDPLNESLRTSILTRQVIATSSELGISAQQAGDYVRSYTAAYAYSKGQDPKAILDALNSAQQRILNYSKENPKLFGVDLVTANQIAGKFLVGAVSAAGIGALLFAIGVIMVGPEVAFAAMTAGGLFEVMAALTSLAGGSIGGSVLAVGGSLFALAGLLELFAVATPMITKQMVDNGSIAPGLQITAIKDATELTAKLTGSKAPGPYTSAQFDSIYNALNAEGTVSITDPVTKQSTPFSRIALANLINVLYGDAIASGAAATPSKLTPLLTKYLSKSNAPTSIPSPASVSTSAPATAASPVNVKIFTGVVANGALGAPVAFTERPDDLIKSVEELKDAAKNNLTAFVQSLPGQFYYELAIVSSVKTKSGFTQSGSAVRVQTGTHKNGTPIYKTIYNKFAVMRIGVVDGNGRSVKLKEIVLGPVDATSFQPTSVQMQNVASAITPELFTSDVANISSIVTTQPVTVQPPAAPVPSPTPQPVQQAPTPSPAVGTAIAPQTPAPQVPATVTAPPPPPAPTPVPVNPIVTKAKAATNLSEFYTAIGSSLPDLATRARYYQAWGLGQQSLYTGTVEQNTKMLAYLKTTI